MFVVVREDENLTELLFSTGYVGESHVFSKRAGGLVGASAFQDVCASGEGDVSDVKGKLPNQILACTQRAGAIPSDDAVKCLLCGRSEVSDYPPCSSVRAGPRPSTE